MSALTQLLERYIPLVGTELSRGTMRVSEADISKFLVSVGRSPLKAGGQPAVAPVAMILALGRVQVVPADRYGSDGLYMEVPIGDVRSVAGETDLQVLNEFHADDTLTISRGLIDVIQKEGRSGPMVILEFENRYQRQDGVLVATERYSQICR